MLGTKEFYDLLDSFEDFAKKTIRTGSEGFKKEPKLLWSKGHYYMDGSVNNAFKMFMSGYTLGKIS